MRTDDDDDVVISYTFRDVYTSLYLSLLISLAPAGCIITWNEDRLSSTESRYVYGRDHLENSSLVNLG